MTILILMLVFYAGYSIVNLIHTQFSIVEKIGFGMIIGFILNAVFMFLLEILDLPINLAFVSLGFLFLIGISNFLLFKKRDFKLLKIEPSDKIQFTFAWFLCFFILLYMLYGMNMKNFFWMPAEYDSVTGYDLMGKMIAAEGTMNASIFTYYPYSNANSIARFIYPPFSASGFGLMYLAGFENSKVFMTMLYLGFIFSFYGLIRKSINDTWAIFFTLLMCITPEMFSHSSLALSNLPNAILTSISIICLITYFENKLSRYFWISLLLMVGSMWSRSDSIIYIIALVPVFGFQFLKTKEWKFSVIYMIIAFLPFVIWSLYIKAQVTVNSSEFFIKTLFWDGEKFSLIFGKAIEIILGQTMYYGLTFYLFLLIMALNSVDVVLKQIPIVVFVLVAWFGYTMLYYQMDYAYAGSSEVIMNSSYKRGMFNFVPLCWFFVATSPYSLKWFGKLNQWLFKN